jgi:hypothetical protein
MANFLDKYRQQSAQIEPENSDFLGKYRAEQESPQAQNTQKNLISPFSPEAFKSFMQGGRSMASEMPTGLKEGVLQAVNAVRNKPYEPSEMPQDEWAATGRTAGKAATPLAIGAGLAQLPFGAAIPAGLAIGAATTPGDVPSRAMGALEQAAVPAIPKIASKVLKGLPKIWETLSSELNPVKRAEEVQLGHDVLKYDASKLFNKVGAQAAKRGANLLPVDDDLISKATKFLPESDEVTSLIERVKTGDYQALRNLQTELGDAGANYKASSLPSDRERGKEIFKFRDSINNKIYNHLKNAGHEDLANDLNLAREKYKKLNDVYYSHPSIAKMTKPKSRLIPKNPMNLFSENSNEMKLLIKNHPEIKKELDLTAEKKRLSEVLKKAGYTGLGFGAIGEGFKAYDTLKKLLTPSGDQSSNYTGQNNG